MSTEQRGILCFLIGYLVYDLHGYKRMHVVNATIVAWRFGHNGLRISTILGLKGLIKSSKQIKALLWKFYKVLKALPCLCFA